MVGVVLGPATASATGGFDCRIDDNNLELDFTGSYGRSIPSIHTVSGEFQSKDARTSKSLREFRLRSSDLLQQWWQGNDLKLLIYRETQGENPFASVELIIETSQLPSDDSRYAGNYTLTMWPPVDGGADPGVVEGEVGCSDNQ
ncbi:hypothetical protein [Mycobacterium spongiae]|uniref:Uncharacterized protein n=1 Tax=Mycobacterium spongiae TaxID=886343 RepID=A0A975JW45_9MYCO|nr:hypothetical protein [Mycobacterium spongiae]QUR65783.1 hypothetical protein F6B93_00640 [Mycobacterium spongiae]